MLYNIVMNSVIEDLDFFKEYTGINESELSEVLNIPRSSFHNWRNNRTKVSNVQYEKIYNYIYEEGIRINDLKSQLYKDTETKNRKILYHGAKKTIEDKIDLKHSKNANDFGIGFYLGQNLYQAASFIAEKMNSNVYIFEFNNKQNLKIKEFDVCEEWMMIIAYYRGLLRNYKITKKLQDYINELKLYDIVIAPIADNNMYQIIDDFVGGNITNQQCISSLAASNLGKQYVFLTNRSLEYLQMKERCYLCNEERKYYRELKRQNFENGKQKVRFAMRKYAGKGKYIDELL